MKQIVVKSSQDLQDIITKLTNYNKNFQTKLNELQSEQRKTDAMWDGEANTAFNEEFNKDIRQFTEFHLAVNEYIRQLQTIKTNYENAETNNTRIAKTRR